jgi:hypothetical protein
MVETRLRGWGHRTRTQESVRNPCSRLSCGAGNTQQTDSAALVLCTQLASPVSNAWARVAPRPLRVGKGNQLVALVRRAH